MVFKRLPNGQFAKFLLSSSQRNIGAKLARGLQHNLSFSLQNISKHAQNLSKLAQNFSKHAQNLSKHAQKPVFVSAYKHLVYAI
jgi:hypothetical protein